MVQLERSYRTFMVEKYFPESTKMKLLIRKIVVKIVSLKLIYSKYKSNYDIIGLLMNKHMIEWICSTYQK